MKGRRGDRKQSSKVTLYLFTRSFRKDPEFVFVLENTESQLSLEQKNSV